MSITALFHTVHMLVERVLTCLVLSVCSESEKKTTLDQALRSVLGDLIVSIMTLKRVISAVVSSLDALVFICRLSKRRAVMATCLSLTSVLMQ